MGVLGGSISWGAELKDILVERYSAQLQIRLQAQVAARVHNFAMPSTGVGYASFCIDQVMPHDVQVLIVEFNFNDAYGHDTIASADSSSEQSSSLSFERLIRNMLSRRSPPWLIIVLAVCRGWDKCEHTHRAVASHYAAQGVVSLSLNHDGVQLPISLHHNGSHHPTRAGHAECARLIEHAIMQRSRGCHTWPRLPRPLLPLPLWESAHARWNCKACSYLECNRLQPLATDGFELQGRGSTFLSKGALGKVLGPRSRTLDLRHLTRYSSLVSPHLKSILCGPAQVGWTAATPNSTVAFHVNGGQSGASFLLAMLCSYENVGSASVQLRSRDNDSEVSLRILEMRWNQPSSQQCIHHVGRIGPGNHTLHVTALSSPGDPQRGSNQVKLFGIYSQLDRGVY